VIHGTSHSILGRQAALVGDAMGDGIGDLVVAAPSETSSVTAQLIVYPGTADATFVGAGVAIDIDDT
jgi:hypothetical protein